MDAACFDFGKVCEQSRQQLVGTTHQLARVGQEVDVRDMLETEDGRGAIAHDESTHRGSIHLEISGSSEARARADASLSEVFVVGTAKAREVQALASASALRVQGDAIARFR